MKRLRRILADEGLLRTASPFRPEPVPFNKNQIHQKSGWTKRWERGGWKPVLSNMYEGSGALHHAKTGTMVAYATERPPKGGSDKDEMNFYTWSEQLDEKAAQELVRTTAFWSDARLKKGPGPILFELNGWRFP